MMECDICGTVSDDVARRHCGCVLCSDCYEYEDHPKECRDYEHDIEEDSRGWF